MRLRPARVGAALAFYREIALAERRWASLAPLARQRARSLELRPRFEAFQRWLHEQLAQTHPRTPLQQALEYALRHWEGLSRFLKDGRIPWTNNESERHLRHLAVGRHAWLFRGSEQGAKHACVLWSLMLGCKQHGIDARRYLFDPLEALSTTTTSRLLELSPKAYAERQRQRQAAA